MIGDKAASARTTRPRAAQLRRYTPMKYMSLILAIAGLGWSHAHAEDICGVGGASALAECLNEKQMNEDKHLNAVYNLIMRMFDAGAAEPRSRCRAAGTGCR